MREKMSKRVVQEVLSFIEKKQRYDRITKQFNEHKANFEEAMEECFKQLAGTRKNIVINTEGKTITVTRVAKTTIEWFADKLQQHVAKEVFLQCVKKRYEVVNMKELVQYLKSCNVDPKIFKRFISVEETVDSNAIERASERGLLEVKDIQGCYLVHCSKPYFQVRIKEGQEDE